MWILAILATLLSVWVQSSSFTPSRVSESLRFLSETRLRTGGHLGKNPEVYMNTVSLRRICMLFFSKLFFY